MLGKSEAIRMTSPERRSVFFMAAGTSTSSAGQVRCVAVSRELCNRGYESACFFSPLFFDRAPDLLTQISRWKQIIEEPPNFLIVNKSSNIVDYEMIKRIKKLCLGTKVIFDFDDAIFYTRLPGRIAYSHLKGILSTSDAVTVGSHYLKEFASKFNENVFLLPSAVDMTLFDPRIRRSHGDFIIGWLGEGTPYQLRYLEILKDPLNALAKKYDFRFKIVSALSKQVRQAFTNQRFDADFGLDHWVPLEEVPELIADFDIGVMPLTDDKWAKGKCAMKLLEYLSMKLATVSSAVGENRYVIDHGSNGFLASSPQEWMDDIERLIVDPDLRKELGENGYKSVKECYSLQAVVDTLEQVIKELDD
jgi:glycosyltransferase involved in cell wall biosynthesis